MSPLLMVNVQHGLKYMGIDLNPVCVLVLGTLYSVLGIWYLVLGALYLILVPEPTMCVPVLVLYYLGTHLNPIILGTWFMVYGIWYLVLEPHMCTGTRNMVLNSWYLKFDTWYIVVLAPEPHMCTGTWQARQDKQAPCILVAEERIIK